MPSTTNIIHGTAIEFKNQPWLIISTQFVNPGKGAAFTRAKLKNLKTGQVMENTFKSGESVEMIDMSKNKCQFLYKEGSSFNFMDNSTYEQFSLEEDTVGEGSKYLLEGTECYALYLDGIPVSIEIPQKMDFKVVEAPPGLKGDTATGGSKEVTIETGTKVKVPLFIKEGDVIKVNTETNEYFSKA
jgi:elongation factor P